MPTLRPSAPVRARAPLTRPARLSPRDVLVLGMLGIRTRKVRAALSALGISLGIATMIVVTAVPASSRQALLDQLSALGPNMLKVEVQKQDPPVALDAGAPARASRIGPVTAVSAVANTHATVHRSDRTDPADYAGLTVLATRDDLLPVINATMRAGRFLDRTNENFPTVVLGSVAAARLGFPGLGPGKPDQIFINHDWFTVVGILARTPLSPDIDRSVLVGWHTAERQLRFDGHPTVLYVKARESAVEDVQAVLPAAVNPSLPGVVQVSRPSDALTAKRATQSTLSALFLALAAVSLLVGGIGVANTMVISVLERRREIGLRRALGAHRGQIRLQFLTESAALSGLGGATGTLLGVLASLGYATTQGWPPVIPPATVAAGVAGSLLVGVAAGVYPAVKASRLTPTQALAAS
ncbi:MULTISPECIES: ABC transporter permease [unclassified Streptomyces]|uniref:ABC transporter permease n=1 Tax=unclassified Streptomyces TaxID=2593676 RepID=UPI0037F8C464